MKSIKIIELAKIMSKNNFLINGIRPGEKLHETLFSLEEYQAQDIYEDKNKYIILPKILKSKSKFKKLKKSKITEYVSNKNNNYTNSEIKKLLF